jgi:hypothetical protein
MLNARHISYDNPPTIMMTTQRNGEPVARAYAVSGRNGEAEKILSDWFPSLNHSVIHMRKQKEPRKSTPRPLPLSFRTGPVEGRIGFGQLLANCLGGQA